MKSLAPLLPTLLFAACASTTTQAPSPEQIFQRADTNGDGVVGRDEAVGLMIADAFARFDLDGDGYVDEQEYIQSGGKADKFREMDRSGTGKLTLEDAKASPLVFNTMATPFDEADTNGSGTVNYEEYLAYIRRVEAAVR
jgi:Ca2+-binding EF-hand superfamily protein